MLEMVPVRLIADGTRLRPANESQVSALMRSIGDVGILNPVTLYRRKVLDGIAVDGYGIVAGLHRVTAARRLGMDEIPAHIVSLNELERQIAECDENLCGPKLSPSEEALFTKRRKEAYEALHPETKYDSRPGRAGKCRQLGDNIADRFTADTAAKTGRSERAIQRNAERGEKIDEEILERIKGTHLDSGLYMDSLKRLSTAEQRAKVNRDLDRERREQEKARREKQIEEDTKAAAEFLADLAGRENIAAVIAILESTPTKGLCSELRRYI